MEETAVTKQGPPPFYRRRFYVHPIQRKYFFVFLFPLTICAFLVIFLTFIPLNLDLRGSATDLQKAAILAEIQALSVTIWPAFLISMLACGILSFFITHKFAGPLYRIEQILRKTKEGDLPLSVRIRQSDDLQEFVALLDGTFKTIASALIAIKEQQALAVREIATLQRRVEGGSHGEIARGLEGIGRNLKEVENILTNFRLPSPPASN
jgi:hypothetical protein